MNQDLLVQVLKRAEQRGATAADGYLVEETRFGASVRMGEIENISHSREQRLSPERDESLWIEMTRMDGPDAHACLGK